MEIDQQAYEIPGQHLRWRVSQLQQQGYPYTVQPAGGGVYIVIVQQPAGVNPFAYQPPPRQAWPAWDSANVLRWVLVVTVVTMLLGAAYMVFSASQAEQPSAQAEDAGSVWDWFDGLRLPWEPDAPAAPAAQATQDDGWQWPWESAIESVQATVTTVSAGILGVLVLLIVLALVRRKR